MKFLYYTYRYDETFSNHEDKRNLRHLLKKISFRLLKKKERTCNFV